MKIAIFSDIHGNISGLKTILRTIDNAGGADMLIAAGDLVGGGPGTDDLLDLLQERQVKMLRGNAEEIWLDMNEAWNQMYELWKEMEPDRDFDLEREKWISELRPTAEWMQGHLSKSNFELLAQLPLSLTVDVPPGLPVIRLPCHSRFPLASDYRDKHSLTTNARNIRPSECIHNCFRSCSSTLRPLTGRQITYQCCQRTGEERCAGA